MITKIKCYLLNSSEKAWKIEKENKEGVSYSGYIMSDEKENNEGPIFVKMDKKVFDDVKDLFFSQGVATVEIKKSTYNNVEKINFNLLKFEY